MNVDLPPKSDDPAPEDAADLVRAFVEHWGTMARSWGINASMGEMFALLYVTGEDWTAEDLRDRLKVSRGNVSMNLRELIAWGVVHKVHRKGERREYYRAEGDVWILFRRILGERKRRELDPTLGVLDRAVQELDATADRPRMLARIEALRSFFAMIDALATQLTEVEPETLKGLRDLFSRPDAPA